MGVLDEAIRQHIELKRRHGASEQELLRKQEEALGPARRGAQADASDGEESVADAPPGAQAESASETAETPFSEQETRIFSAADGSEDVALVDEPDVVDADEPEAGERDDELDVAPAAGTGARPAPVDDWLESESESESKEEPESDLPPPPAEPLGADAEDLTEGVDPSGEPEDVLEETPEFLQETPEHDRLWFEQKPPRDFDFDDDK